MIYKLAFENDQVKNRRLDKFIRDERLKRNLHSPHDGFRLHYRRMHTGRN